PQKFTAYMNAAAENALQPLIVLDWSNRHYDYEGGDFTLPHSDFGRNGYVNYVRNVLERYNGQIPFVEVWNEVNAGTFVAGPATTDKPGYYSLLLRETYRAIKSTHPSVKIIAGATVPIAHGFFKSLFEKESLPYLDAVSIHPYLNFPDSVALEISELRELIKLYNDGQTKPIWVTEFSLDASSEADRDTAASHLAQIASLMLSEQVERMYYYLMTDDASFPFRGLFGDASDVRGAFRPHPALVAYATLIRQLGGAVFQHRFSTSPSTYALSFERGEEQVSVLWSNHPLTVSLATSSALVITDMMGGTSRKSPQDGSVSVELSKNVQYVIGPITSITEVDNDLLADSVSGYSKNVGENGWYYGYAKVGSNQTYRPSKFKEMTWGIWGSDNYRWLGKDEYLFASGSQMHPSTKWAIRRWVSNVAAKVTLFGLISRGEGGDGVNIRIFLDGNEIYNRDLLAGESISYSIPKVKVKIGSKVDFVLNPRGDNSFDATTFTSTILRYSKSSSAAGRLKEVTPTKLEIAASD
ncbi:MAG TPA: glycosyl hydrolase, partial [Terrimicrobiaceae bacterium]